jgi:hypothetical protein
VPSAFPRFPFARLPRRLVWVGVIGALFLGVSAGGAAAADDPGGSAPDQYQEEIPTSTGPEPTNGSGDGGQSGGGGGSGGSPGGSGGQGASPGGGGATEPRGTERDPGDRAGDGGTTGSGGDGEGWTSYAPLGEGGIPAPEAPGGVGAAVSAAGEASPHVLALLALALLTPLAAFVATSSRGRRKPS